MSQSHTVILHGYSDCSESFVDLKSLLEEKSIGTVDTILYGDYESREDNITFNDVVDGLNDQMIEKGIIDGDGEKLLDLNVIVHSTGGLVIRHWIWRYYNDCIEECPVKRVVMLAPANFGSPLAHRGKSFLGRLVKGRWKVGDFLEVGRKLLTGLELGSPYQWELAHRDLFRKEGCYFNKDQIQLTILVGIEDYKWIKGWVGKPGTDGTVVISGTSLDSLKLGLDFSDPSVPYEWIETSTASDVAFGVLPKLDHGSIVDRFKVQESLLSELTIEALTIQQPEEFETFQGRLKSVTGQTYQIYTQSGSKHEYSKYQQFILHGIDDHGEPITDYTIDFYVYKVDKIDGNIIGNNRYFNKKEERLSKKIHDVLVSEIHTHSKDPSYRRLLVNLNEIYQLIGTANEELGPFALSMKIFVPKIDKGIYYDLHSLQNVVIYRSDITDTDTPELFFPNTTTLIEFKVNRKTKYVTLGKNPRK